MALRRREFLLLAGVGATAAAAGFLAGPLALDRSGGGAEMLAEAAFHDLTGTTRGVAEWRGRVVIVNFWATWCAPCREEIPMFQAAREFYAPKGLEIVGIAIDSAVKVGEFVDNLKIRYPILLAGGNGLALMRALGNTVGGLPYTVLLDRDGAVVHRKLGPLHRPELDALLAPLLSGNPG